MIRSGLSRGVSLVPAFSSARSPALVLGAASISSRAHIARRRREAQGYAPSVDVADQDFLTFPNEYLGNQYDVNWTLNAYKVIPRKYAFRNLSVKGLVQHADGKTSPKKGLIMSTDAQNEKFVVHYAESAPGQAQSSPSTPPNPAASPSPSSSSSSPSSSHHIITTEQYRGLLKEVKTHLSDVDAVFMHDGAIGSHRAAEAKVRAITDSPATALYMRHMFPKVALGDINDFKHDLTAYIAPSLKLASPEAHGLKSGAFSLVDSSRGIVVVAGTSNPAAITQALVAAATPRFFKDKAGLFLHADAVGGFGSGKPLLVFSPPEDPFLSTQAAEVTGASHVAWTKDGVYRVFDGVSRSSAAPHDVAKQLGDLVEMMDAAGKTARVTTPLSGVAAHGSEHPQAIVFLTSDESVPMGVTRLNPDQVHLPFLARYSGPSTLHVNDLVPKFKELVAASGAQVYIINTRNLKGDVSPILKSIRDQTVKSEPLAAKLEKSLGDLGRKAFPALA